jgi:hypothetical protein
VTRPTIKLATTSSTIYGTINQSGYGGVGLLSERLILTYTGPKTTVNVKPGTFNLTRRKYSTKPCATKKIK